MKTVTVGGNLKLACVMVGLPARGKTFIAQKVSRYLRWLGINIKIFNVGTYRRRDWGASQPHSFFDPNNEEGKKQREQSAWEALEDMFQWFDEGSGEVALYDATNSTSERRQFILEHCNKKDVQVMFIESICDNEKLILQNIMAVKTSSPDYSSVEEKQTAVQDFRNRIEHYAKAYETITDNELTYIKLINVGSKYIVNKIRGYLESRVVYYLMNLHIIPRNIFISRHGESVYNTQGKIGGDSELSPQGQLYAEALPKLISTHLKTQKLRVWTSTLRRTIATGAKLPYPKLQWKSLDELDAGVCDGLTYEEIAERFPEDYANRDNDKFNYRYRGGESYHDLVLRLEPVIMELERQEDIVIIGHQAILRCIYAYFMDLPQDRLPYINIPLHTLIRLTPMPYGTTEERFFAEINAVDTFRPKPPQTHPSPPTNQ
ncbi:Fructose-2,6-bisphosphatase [Entomophthora muscae]|uniref:Fructose-2,6-bisphosphatase n=2 Tax=Entomophthora muscae TaxID=34485 RepID=A0ACC2TQJ3_9FUNG|nr:Fructose-2,6-bisphosphatase [Entomophthora muscae]KAJ9076867.1 Fructose-2,6-bisphosphatase [Entomophthora muscae]